MQYNCENCRHRRDIGMCDYIKECVVSTTNPVPSHWSGYSDIEDDMVNEPSHYQTKNGLQTIDVIEAFTDDLKGIEATDTGNIIKYICRWKKKNGLEDLKKAQWYLNHLIKHLEEEK